MDLIISYFVKWSMYRRLNFVEEGVEREEERDDPTKLISQNDWLHPPSPSPPPHNTTFATGWWAW